MKEKWMQLEDRERQKVVVGSALLVLILFYFFILSPLKNSVDLLQSAKSDNEALIVWMKDADLQLSHAASERNKITQATSQTLLSITQQALNASTIAAASAEIKQNTNKTVTVQLKSVNFDGLMEWLITLWMQYHINADRVDIEALEEAGLVQASVVLKA